MHKLTVFLVFTAILFLGVSVTSGQSLDASDSKPFSAYDWLKSTPSPHSTTPKGADITAAQVIGNGGYRDIRPAVAYNSQATEYLVAYESERGNPGPDDILGQRVYISGTPIGDTISLALASSSSLAEPDIAYNSTNNQYLLVFQSEQADIDIYARVLGGNGVPIGTTFIPITTASYNDLYPRVAYNSASNEYLVVWQHFAYMDEFSNYDIYAQRVSATGALLGGRISIAVNNLEDAINPAVAAGEGFSTSQGYFVVWQVKVGTTYDIHGIRLNNNGSFSEYELAFSDQGYTQAYPRVAYDPDNDTFLVVWQYDYYGNGTDWDIASQRVYAFGGLAGDFLWIEGSSVSTTKPEIAFHANAHEYLVSYEYWWSATDPDVYIRRVDKNGIPREDPIGLAFSGSMEAHPRLAADNNWWYLVVWENGTYGNPLSYDIYGDTAKLLPLAGQVWAGGVGKDTVPVANVTLNLYCSTDSSLGTLIESTQTNGAGSFVLPAADFPVTGYCPYYDIVETDLPNYLSAGATSEGGSVMGDNRIRYSGPLYGQTLNANNFYDIPPSGIVHCNSCADCSAKLEGDYSLVYLDNNISIDNSTCIEFNTSNTIFDCQEHTIQGSISGEEFIYGIKMSFQAQNKITNCKIQGFESGVSLNNSSYNIITDTVTTDNGNGIYLNGSSNNTITNNTMGQNDQGLILFSANNNVLSGNQVCKNTTADISFANANSGNTQSGNICDAIHGLNWNGSGIKAPISWCADDCTPNVQTTCSSAQNCMDSLTGNFNQVILSSNLTVPGGIIIGGSHLELNCAGHSISGGGTGVGITLKNKLQVTIRDCTINNYDTGIYLGDASYNDLYLNTITNNDTGISVSTIDPLNSPTDNQITDNSVTVNNLYGISLSGVSNNTLTNNNLRGNKYYGLWVNNACNNEVNGNSSGNPSGTVLPLLYWHDISNPGIIPNGSYGEIMFCNVQNATIQNLTMDSGTSNGDGIVLLNSSGIQVHDNTLHHTNGIYIANSQQMTVNTNTIDNSRHYALELNNCTSCQVSNNTLHNNPGVAPDTGVGLYVSNSSPQLQISNNTVTENNIGIWLNAVNAPTLSGNTVGKNSSTGLAFSSTGNVTVSQNTIKNNANGITLDLHSWGNLQNNHICYNDSYDILNEHANSGSDKSTGSGNECILVSNWADSDILTQGCHQKCVGWYQFQYGYNFPNPSKGRLSFGIPIDWSEQDYVDTFGSDQVYATIDVCVGVPLCLPFVGCYCVGYEAKIPTGVPDPHALTYYTALYFWAAHGGECQGMTTTSLRFYYGDRKVTDYMPGATKVSDLSDTGDMENAIDAGEGAIRSDELIKNWLTHNGTADANLVLSQVRNSLQTGQLGSLQLFSGINGHAVVATDVRDIDANTARIYYYDSNLPDWSSQYADDESKYRYITIHTDSNTFECKDYPEYTDLWFAPYSKINGPFTIPLKWDGNLFANWGSADSLVTNADGQRLGIQGDQMISEIPQASSYPSVVDGTDAYTNHTMYVLPSGAYTVTLTGTGTGTYGVAVFSRNQMLELVDVPSTASTHDTMTIFHENDDPPSGGFTFTSMDASKTITVTIGERFDTSGSSRIYTLKDCMTVQNRTSVFSVSPDFNSLQFTNRASSPVVCSIELQSSMDISAEDVQQELPTARLASVEVPGMTTASFTPSDWLDLNHATINVNLHTCGDNVCSSGESPKGCPEDCSQQACVTPSDNLHLTHSVVLCPGSYTLTDAGNPGVISVDANNITLNCNGARLVGNGSGTGILASGHSNVSILGCIVQGYRTGIDLQNTTNAQIQGSAVISNTLYGIQATGSQQAQIDENYAVTNGTGLELANSNGIQLSSTLACDNTLLDISAASQTSSTGNNNRCSRVLDWNDVGSMACTYTCLISGRNYFLPIIMR
jgi:parallel beta-helix repeat protein